MIRHDYLQEVGLDPVEKTVPMPLLSSRFSSPLQGGSSHGK